MQPQHLDKDLKRGFTNITSVVILMIATVLIVTSSVLLSSDTFRMSFTDLSEIEARAMANSCVEIAINKLKLSTSYTGNETITISSNTCSISTVTGTGNTNRSFTASSTVRNTTRRINVTVGTVNPNTAITTWDETP